MFFRGAAEAHALDTPKCPRKGKRYIIEKGISQAACEARRCVQGFESPMVHQQNKNTRQPLSLQGWRVFLYDRAKLSKGLKSGNLGTSFRVVE